MHSFCRYLFILLFATFAVKPVFALDYYWVGGTGNWSDYANHWATSSGGNIFHVRIPTPSDNVFFDANSFTTVGDTVYLDTTIINCNTMDWSGAANAPVFYSTSYNVTLEIYGSLLLSPNMIWQMLGTIVLKSTNSGNIINAQGVGMWSSLGIVGSGSWDLQSALSCGAIHLSQGTLRTNGFPLTCSYLRAYSSPGFTLLLDTSVITCSNDFEVIGIPSTQLDADSTTIYCRSFYGGPNQVFRDVFCDWIEYSSNNCTFRNVECERIWGSSNVFNNVSMVSSYNEVEGSSNQFNSLITNASSFSMRGNNNVFDTLIFNNPGMEINLSNAVTVTVNDELRADGTCGQLTSIQSSGTATISKSSGTVSLDYVLLKNITATGGATFIANNSVNAGNVTGITINAPPARSLYWVGGTGNWNDVNHWATSSGGPGGSCAPTQYDDVFFDANSFSAGDTVYFNVSTAYCLTMDWSGATGAPLFYGTSYTVTLEVYGSLLLSPNMIWQVRGTIRLKSANSGNIIDAQGVGMWSSLGIVGSGSWDLQSALSCGAIHLSQGTLRTNGFPLTCSYLRAYSSPGFTLLLDTSVITCSNDFEVIGIPSTQLDADSTTIYCRSFYGGPNQVFRDVFCDWIEYSSNNCTFRNVECERIWGSSNVFNNVSMVSSYNEVEGSSNQFNSLITNASSFSMRGNNNVFDTLIFNNPGMEINLSNAVTVTVNDELIIQSDGGFPTSIKCTNGTATISKSTGTVCTDFIYLQNITATGGAQFFAGEHSVDLGGNSGWTWTRCNPLISDVWPGDANYDLVVDNLDILNIGVAYNYTGYARPSASLNFVAQPCQHWNYQFINSVNLKHADCDGDSNVTVSDTNAVALNYGLTHPLKRTPPLPEPLTGYNLYFEFAADSLTPGMPVTVPVKFGTSDTPIQGVYGIAFTINYDSTLIQPGSMSLVLDSSWIIAGLPQYLTISRDFSSEGKIDFALCRTDHQDVSGFGTIATLNFIVAGDSGNLEMSFSRIKSIMNDETDVPVSSESATITVIDVNTGIENIASHEMLLVPNPTQGDFSIHIPDFIVGETTWLTISDIQGRKVYSEVLSGDLVKIENQNLNSGMYFVTVTTGESRFTQKLVID